MPECYLKSNGGDYMVVKNVEKAAKSAFSLAQTVVTLVVTAVVLVLLGLVFFMVNLWIVQVGSSLLSYSPSSDWAVFAAAVLTAASMVGSKGFGFARTG
ncbi:MAG: hypothetical protein QXT25_03725 [Candidatus Anstonellaceae archaeon]